ncbi:MAG: hypothetical protein MMC23_007455 [Stictis urceolatum]|nr:hypothetical protein [Stictis urceolata]
MKVEPAVGRTELPKAQESSSIKAISLHAFSIVLLAYDDGIQDRTGRSLFQVETLDKRGSTTERLDAVARAAPETLPNVVPSNSRLPVDLGDEAAIIVLPVGMLLSSDEISTKKSNKAGKQAKEESVNSMKNIDLITIGPLTKHVVCPRNRETVAYYALVKQNEASKLCTNIMFDIKNVCFFPEFRNDALTSVFDRKRKWSE